MNYFKLKRNNIISFNLLRYRFFVFYVYLCLLFYDYFLKKELRSMHRKWYWDIGFHSLSSGLKINLFNASAFIWERMWKYEDKKCHNIILLLQMFYSFGVTLFFFHDFLFVVFLFIFSFEWKKQFNEASISIFFDWNVFSQINFIFNIKMSLYF